MLRGVTAALLREELTTFSEVSKAGGIAEPPWLQREELTDQDLNHMLTMFEQTWSRGQKKGSFERTVFAETSIFCRDSTDSLKI